ncbi:glycosyltransferase [Pelagibacterium mangrovi]|uniref:glycosyltransferase n=1 Tax=Pelagibacterium mangrovi TaxID=3119828 RepID=UPI002FC8FA56
MKKILYTGNYRLFPADAAGRRVLQLALALRQTGHCVLLAPRLGQTPANTMEFDEHTDYDQELSSGAKFAWLRLLREVCAAEKYHAVILYNPSNTLALMLRIATKIRGIHAALDITEWYEYSHLSSWLAKAEVFVRMNITYRLFSRMIFISDYLESSYNPKIGRVIPPLMTEAFAVKHSRHPVEPEPLKIFYAGFPGKKDRIDLLVNWLNKVSLPFPIQLILAGPKADQVVTTSAQLNKLQIVALGPVDRRTVFKHYQNCHVMAIIRDDARYEWAGFPTKSVEGWSLGVPVLVMSHSRFAMRAREYGAAAVIEASDPIESLERELWKIYFDEDYLNKLSAAALQLVNDHHQVDTYVSSMNDIVS